MDTLGLTDGLTEEDGLIDGLALELGEIEGLIETEGLTDGEAEDPDERFISNGLLPLSLRLISNAIC